MCHPEGSGRALEWLRVSAAVQGRQLVDHGSRIKRHLDPPIELEIDSQCVAEI
jgi:hypothetical protein